MAERRPVIPENQLLDLIQNPSKAQELAQKHARERSVRGFFSLAAWRGRLSFFFAKMTKGRKYSSGLNGINRLLYVLIGVLFVFFVLHLVFSMKHVSRIPDFAAGAPKVSRTLSETAAEPVKVSDYLDKPHVRDIFKFGEAAPASKVEAAAVAEDDVQSTEEETGPTDHLNLVGIGFSDNPDVMIQNTKTSEVLFLKRGDVIEGDIKVEAIFRDHVILSYKGKEIELQ